MVNSIGISSIITSLQKSKTANIEKVMVKLPTGEFSPYNSINFRNVSSLLKHYGVNNRRLNGVAVDMPTSNPLVKCMLLKDNYNKGTINKFIKELGTDNFSNETFLPDGSITRHYMNGKNYQYYCKQNAHGDVVYLQDINTITRDSTEITKKPNGNVVTQHTYGFDGAMRSGIKSYTIEENAQGKVIGLSEKYLSPCDGEFVLNA